MHKFEWVDGYRARVSAEVAGSVLEPLLEKSNQFIVAKQVIDIARNPNSLIHPAFEWDDSVAAEEFRLYQARKMINSLRVRVEKITNTDEPLRFFVNVKSTKPEAQIPVRSYTSISNAMRDPDLRRDVLSSAFKELDSFRRKYAQFEELARIHAEIDRLILEQRKDDAA